MMLDAVACASGTIVRLPWGWWTCLHDAQEDSQSEVFHNGEIVAARPKARSWNYEALWPRHRAPAR
jgi:hypothetical protein